MFDGHGGKEVAHYSEKHYEDVLRNVEEFKEETDIQEGLRKSFLALDRKIQVEGGLKDIAAMKRENPP